ncbi:MAG: hypothetical protein ABFD66_03070 [Smithella sp.]
MDNQIYLQAEHDHESKKNPLKMGLIIESKLLVDIINYIAREVVS